MDINVCIDEQIAGLPKSERWRGHSWTPTSNLRWLIRADATRVLQQQYGITWERRDGREVHIGFGHYSTTERTWEWLNVPEVTEDTCEPKT
jgi:hypothetical protein